MTDEQKTPQLERFWNYVEKTEGCWNWTGPKIRQGYGVFCQGRKKKTLAHRFSWRLHSGEIPKGIFVCHHCDNPSCVRPEHLFTGTAKDNNRDAIKKGRFVYNTRLGLKAPNRIKNLPRGENHPHVKMTEEKVLEARRLFATGKYNCKQLGKMFGLSQSGMYAVVHRKWGNL